ncbi:hypothetical protein HYS47_02395 [Candidatus Woesearchaeota archaeon]|nr:hypothetical protein [Candidatus Woesearchaeota archaeon]
MDTAVLILIGVLLISILTAIYRTIQKGFHLKILLPVLAAGILVAAGLALNQEVKEFQMQYPSSEKLFLLHENNEFIGGVSGVLTQDGNTTFLDNGQLQEKTGEWQAMDLHAVKGDHYFVFIVSLDAFDKTEREVYFHGQDHNRTFLFQLLESQDATEDYAREMVQQKIKKGLLDKRYEDAAAVQLVQNIQEQIGDNARVKSAVFTALLSNAMEDEGQLFLMQSMKKKTIIMYPQPYFMRLFLIIPDPLLNQLLVPA